MAKVLKQYENGAVVAVEKTCRQDKSCWTCGKTLHSGTKLIAIQTVVVFRKKYWKDILHFCREHPIPDNNQINEWIDKRIL